MPTLRNAVAGVPLRGPRRRLPEGGTAALFLAAPLGFLAVVLAWPLAKEILLSFTDARLANPAAGDFVGLENYRRLAEGPDLVKVLVNTALYTLGTTIVALSLGVSAALGVNRRFAGRGLVRGILAAPWAVPGVTASLVWLWMFNDRGILNRILDGVGLGPVAWLASPGWAMVSVVIVTAWLFAPFVMLVVLAALQSVPGEVAEAARVDGASGFATFRFVTWPHIVPTVRLVALLVTIWSLRRWDVIDVMTGGGPVNSTSTIVVATQRQAFEYQNVGNGAAYAVVGIALASMLALAYVLLERRELRKADAT